MTPDRIAEIEANDYRPDRNGVAAYRQSDLAAKDVPALLAEVKQLTADRDRARDAAVALEQENAQLQDVLKVTDRLELSTRKDVAQARDAVHEGRSAEALDTLSDLLESLGGKR